MPYGCATLAPNAIRFANNSGTLYTNFSLCTSVGKHNVATTTT